MSGATDVSSVDVSAGLKFAFSCAGADLSSITYATASTSNSTTCSVDDGPATQSISAAVVDKDNGVRTYASSASITNVAPTATLGNNGPVDEGSPATIELTGASDPSTSDTTAGFKYAFSCTNGDLSGADYASASTTASTSCTFNDNGVYPVKGRILDKDGGYTEASTSVSVTNVAPTATMGNDGPVYEGSPATISFSAQSDPSTADTAAGFHYAFSCDNSSLATATYAGSGTDASTQCTYSDNQVATVRARIIDKDGGVTEYTTEVTVNNAAPTATLTNNGPRDEGSSVSVTFSGATDPSSVDVAAGLAYVFSCSNGDLSGFDYETAFAADSTTCTFFDNGTYTVKGRIYDKDDGFTQYTTSVTVNNVAPTPTITNLSGNGGVACLAGNTVSLSFAWTDPAGTYDTYDYSVAWGDSTTSTGSNASSPVTGLTHTYSAPGPRTITVTVSDEDGGSAPTSSVAFSFTYNVTGVLQPVNDTQAKNLPSVFKYGSTVPVKIKVTDCAATPVSGLAPTIAVKKLMGTTPTTGEDEPLFSTSGADTGTVMRYDTLGGQYIYNLATKSLSDSTATYEIKITDSSFANPVTTQFGTRSK